jgi:putative membrane protein
MIAVLAVIITVVVLSVRWLGGASSISRRYSTPEKTPLDILKERFARGEIDKQEFEEKSRILSRLP